VDRQRLVRQQGCDFSGLVAGSVGYLKAKFHFSEEWDECAKVASFCPDDNTEYPIILDEDDCCLIPAEALKGAHFFVHVVGGRPEYRLATNKLKIMQEVTINANS
jgi:hypothetical protein